jgi:dTMP kinase
VRGILISLEGIEGTGKTTQAVFLADYLKQKGFRVTKTEEPGGTEIGLQIRKLLLSPESSAMDSLTELLLYNASRVQHIREVIMPLLEMGDIVVTDRFSDSTVAYQGYGRGIDLKLLDALDLISTQKMRPDLTILLDIDVETGLRRNRRVNKDDRIEREDISFHERVRQGFIHIAALSSERIRMVDCSGSVDAVSGEIASIVDEFLERYAAAKNK